MKTWRPEGWDNPYSEDKKLTKPWTEWHQSDAELAFEAGADALLKAIREEIEKALLTDEEIWAVQGKCPPDIAVMSAKELFKFALREVVQAQLQKILALLVKDV
jgi:hypothetical protein